jgi:hypothetical protein
MNVVSDHGPCDPVITRIGGLVPVAEETKSGLGTGHSSLSDYQAQAKAAMCCKQLLARCTFALAGPI